MLRPRHQYSGPTYEWVGCTEHGWGRCTMVLSGERLVCGLPLQTCLMSLADQKKIPMSSVKDIQDVASHFVDIPYEKFMELGGSYIYLRAGQGVVIPPLYMVGHLNGLNLEFCPTTDTVSDGLAADVVEPFPIYSQMFLFYLNFAPK